MKLVTLSRVSIAGSAVGLIVLIVVALQSLDRMRVKQSEVAALLELRERIDEFSVASDSLLLFRADPGLWNAYREDARAIQERLRSLGGEHPQARKAARHMELIVESLSDTLGRPPEQGAEGAETSVGPVGLPPRARIIMNQVAGHGVALDSALDVVLRERQQLIAGEANWIAGTFAGSTLLFALLCIVAFGVMHRRVSGPARELVGTMRRVREGDLYARAEVAGSDELAELAGEFNRLVEQRRTVDERLRDQQAELRRREAMLADSQRMAAIGSWRLDIAADRLDWSDETYRLLGVSPETFAPTPDAFNEFVHPEDRERVLSTEEHALRGALPHDVAFRIVRADGEVRYVHERAEVELDGAGSVVALAGTIQDITERKRDEERLTQYRQLIEASEDAYAIGDSEHRYILVNQAYANWFGLDHSEVEGRLVPEILGEDYFESHVKPALDRALAGEVQVFETRRTYRGMGTRDLLLRYYPIASPDGGVRQVGAVITDITELKQVEAELDEQSRLVNIAGRTARLGGWSADLASGRILWSDVVAEIHGMPPGYSPTLEEGIDFYPEEWRGRITALFTACAEKGVPYDKELEIVTAGGERRWVRAVGEPVRDEQGDIVRVQGAFQDVTAQKEAELERNRLAEETRNILESITDAFFTLDNRWRFGYINSAAEELLERPRAELTGRDVWQEFPEAVGTRIEQSYRRAIAEQVTVALEEYYPPLGKWFDIRAYPTDEGLAVYFQDSTERHHMVARLREQEENLRASRDDLEQVLDTRQALINSLPAHIALLDAGGNILDVNEQWRHFGLENEFSDPDFGVGRNYLVICANATGECAEDAHKAAEGLRAVLSGARDTFSLEYPCHSPDAQRWFRVMANRLVMQTDGAGSYGAVVMHVDITERKQAEQQLNRLVYEDPLTGLASRTGFVRAVSDFIDRAGWPAGSVVVMLNVQRLRDVNEAHGYEAGDQLLTQIGGRLKERAGDTAIVGRPGGDDFAVFLPDDGANDPEQRLELLGEAFSAHFDLDSAQVVSAARFGYTRLDDAHPRTVESLMREAELALQQIRTMGTGPSWSAYTRDLDREVTGRIEITQALRHAVTGDQFVLHFQPKVELDSGRMIACEALLRWTHPEWGLLAPGRFIPLAEQSQLIGPIGDWVIHEACRCLRGWMDAELDVVRLAVNVSLVQFMVGDFAETVRDALAVQDLDPSALTLEITESVFESGSRVLLRQLETLHDLGVHLSLDDFGTGYSSLLYLQQYPFDEIKIDKRFVQRIADDPYSRHIVQTIMGVAEALGAGVVAEGVENRVMRDALMALGCSVGQGYYYSMPLAAGDFRSLLESRRALPSPTRDCGDSETG